MDKVLEASTALHQALADAVEDPAQRRVLAELVIVLVTTVVDSIGEEFSAALNRLSMGGPAPDDL